MYLRKTTLDDLPRVLQIIDQAGKDTLLSKDCLNGKEIKNHQKNDSSKTLKGRKASS